MLDFISGAFVVIFAVIAIPFIAMFTIFLWMIGLAVAILMITGACIAAAWIVEQVRWLIVYIRFRGGK